MQCLNNRWFSQGYFVRKFESRFADYIGVKHAITCSSGTAALHLAMLALGVSDEDAVIVPALTYVATANAARYCGAKVLFSDINPSSWCLDFDDEPVIEGIPDRVLSIPVHMYDAICEVLNYASLIVDCCHAVGTPLVGQRGLMSCFSFYASKHISCGEGGMITTNSDELAERIRLYRGQGATTPGTYHHSIIGYNYRMTDLQAAVGLAQLETLDERVRYRREIINQYRARLGNNPKITLQGGERASAWMFACLLPNEPNVVELTRAALSSLYQIETRPFFKPLNSLPMYGSHSSSTPIATEISRRGICLPTHCELDDSDVDYVCDSLEEVLG
jgi:perosamine synthetase